MPQIPIPDAQQATDPVAIAKAEASWRAIISLHVQNLLKMQEDGFREMSTKLDKLEEKVDHNNDCLGQQILDQTSAIKQTMHKEDKELQKEINKIKRKNAYWSGAIAALTSGVTIFIIKLIIGA